MKIFIALLSFLAAAVSPAASAESAGQSGFHALHEAGVAFENALRGSAAPTAGIEQLRHNLETEAERVEHAVSSARETRIYNLYSTAAAEYADSAAKYSSGAKTKERFDADVREVMKYLQAADEEFSTQASPPAAAPVRAASVTSPTPAAAAAAAPATPAPAATPADEPREASPAELTINLPINKIRTTVNRVRIERKKGKVRPCSLVADVAVPGKTNGGTISIQGHNFFYGSPLELARFETTAAGGDTFLIKTKSKNVLAGEAYRCR